MVTERFLALTVIWIIYGVTEDSGLLSEDSVKKYLAETAPVDFNGQEFIQAGFPPQTSG